MKTTVATGEASSPAAMAELQTPEISPPSRWAQLATTNVLWILIILIALVVIFTVMNHNFLRPFNIRSIFADNASLIILAVGECFVIVTAGIDLSVGTVLIFSGVIAGKTFLALGSANSTIAATKEGWGYILIGLAAGIIAGTAVGVVNGWLVAKAKIPALIVTLGTFGIALGASYLLTGGTDLRGMPTKLSDTIGFGLMPGGIPYIVIIAAGLALLAGLSLSFTRFGAYTYAIGSNQEAARRVGIKVDRHLIKVYGLMGLLAGCAGVISLAHYTTTTIAGHTSDNLSAIAACVIGGTSLFGGRGTVGGAVIGVLIPATLQSGFVIIGVNPYWQFIAVGVVLIGAVYLDQWRRRTRERT